MRKPVLILAAAVAVAAAAFGIYATSGSTTSQAAGGQRRAICDFLDDGAGNGGSAISATPGKSPKAGEVMTMQRSGAWNLCYNNGSDLSLYLASAQGWCVQAENGLAVLEQCDSTNTAQEWTTNKVAGGETFHNKGFGGVMGATGGVGSEVAVAASIGFSAYHKDLNWFGVPVKQP